MRSIVKRIQTTELFERSIVVDLDDTICHPNEREEGIARYANAIPEAVIIKRLRKLAAIGWYITIHTSRHMKTCENDADLAFEKLADITAKWLDVYNVPWDALIFGKPYGKFYIDDKAMTPDEFDDWAYAEVEN